MRSSDDVIAFEGPGARFTVGTESREWVPGEVMCFDDSYVHEAEHLGDEDRSVTTLSCCTLSPFPPLPPKCPRRP